MDELVIADKKYVSSKRAAELTGYAKDYIGQLCREGRIEARLVGRSWYVLETSVLEHRFGKEENGAVPEAQMVEKPIEEPISTWQSPTYTAEAVAPLPELKIERPPLRSHINLLAVPQNMPVKEERESPMPEEENEQAIEPKIDEIVPEISSGEVSIPLHKVAELHEHEEPRDEEIYQAGDPEEAFIREERVYKKKQGNSVGVAIVIAIAVVALAVILIGTGITEKNALLGGKNSTIINFLGGKSFYNK